MIHRTLICFLSSLFCACVSAGEPKPLRIVTQRADDRVEAYFAEGLAVISIHSPTGIGHASLQRSEDHWPKKITLRLHLRGLESLHIVSGQVDLELSISSHNGEQRSQLRMDQHEPQPLDETSPYWTKIRMVGKDGRPATAIPLSEGTFEIELPQILLAPNSESASVSWVDFYR